MISGSYMFHAAPPPPAFGIGTRRCRQSFYKSLFRSYLQHGSDVALIRCAGRHKQLYPFHVLRPEHPELVFVMQGAPVYEYLHVAPARNLHAFVLDGYHRQLCKHVESIACILEHGAGNHRYERAAFKSCRRHIWSYHHFGQLSCDGVGRLCVLCRSCSSERKGCNKQHYGFLFHTVTFLLQSY